MAAPTLAVHIADRGMVQLPAQAGGEHLLPGQLPFVLNPEHLLAFAGFCPLAGLARPQACGGTDIDVVSIGHEADRGLTRIDLLRQALAAWSDGYDHVLCDLPPLLLSADAELFIVAAQLSGKPALFIVESSSAGLSVKADPSMGIRAAALGRVELKDVTVPLAARLGEDDATDQDYSDAIALSRLGWAALAVGTSHAVLDYVIPYVKEREAFGEPIARRQSVAFMCANIAIELDGLRLVTWRGASRAEQGLPFAREAALARKLASDKGMQIGLDGVQLLGGHGYTKEHPVERWYRDLRAIGVAEGVVVL